MIDLMLASLRSVFAGGGSPTAQGIGPTWDPKRDPRIAEYGTCEMIYDGDHFAAMKDLANKLPPGTLEVIANYPRLITTIPADLMLGEPFQVNYPDDDEPSDENQKAVDEIIKRSMLHTTAYETAVDCGWAGDQVLVAERNEDGEARIRTIRPDIWFPEANPEDVRDILVHRLAWIADGSGARPKKYLRVLEHHKGEIRNRLFVLRDTRIEEEVTGRASAWQDVYPDVERRPLLQQDTDVDDFLLVHIPNGRKAKNYFGESDYTKGMKSLFASVDQRLSQTNKILADHAEPAMGIPEQLWMAIHGGNQALAGVDARKLKVLRMGPNGEKPEYITWDGQLTDSMAFVQEIKNTILQLAEIDRQLVGEGDQANLSGRALRQLLVRTLAKVNRKWKYVGDGLERAISLAAQLEGLEVDGLWVDKADGLPTDTREEIDASIALVEGRLSSRQREMAKLHDLSDKQVEALMSEIDAEDDAERNSEALNNAVNNPARQSQRPNPIEVRLGT